MTVNGKLKERDVNNEFNDAITSDQDVVEARLQGTGPLLARRSMKPARHD